MRHLITAALCCAAASFASDYKINASQIVTGTLQPIDWTQEALVEASNQYLTWHQSSTVSSVWENHIPFIILGPRIFVRPDYYCGTGWAPQQASWVQYPCSGAVELDTTSSTSGNWKTTYSNPYVVKAAVTFPGNGVEARVSNGSATSDFNYRITAWNPQPIALDYFLSFPTPKSGRNVSVAYSLSSPSDPGGGTYSYVNTQYSSSRSAADVYVDGLPVFTTAKYFSHNKAYQDAFTNTTAAAGVQAPDPEIKIYLGKIPSGGSFTIDLVMRAEAAANSPTCGSTNYIQIQPPNIKTYNCYDLDEYMPIPANNPYVGLNLFALKLN